ncbi:MAG: hormogonium polysaccharide biosynthesis glycosyltransferase HpsE [Cyanobacteria bacterium J06554_6]
MAAKNTTVHVSVAIPTYNGAQRLPAVLDRLRSQQKMADLTWEVLVCDNNSIDTTADVVRQYQQDWPEAYPLRYIFAAQQGAAFARQRAVEQAKGEIIAFLDDDNLPSPDWLYNVFQFSQVHPEAGAFGSQIHGQFEGPLPDGFSQIACFLAIIERGSEPHQYKPHTKILPPAAGLAVRRQAWLESVPKQLFLNNKGKSAGLASEDLEALLHIQKAGWEIWYNPDMVVNHLIPNGRLQKDYLVSLFRCIGLSRYYIRLLGVKDWQRPLMVPAYIANDLRKLALHTIRSRYHRETLPTACERELLKSTLQSPIFLLQKACSDLQQTYRDMLQMPQQQDWLDRLTVAFELEQFHLYRQRIRALEPALLETKAPTDRSDHYELLIRLADSAEHVCGEASPGQFLPVAERYGLTITIDRWVVRRYVRSHIAQLHSINLSAASVCDDSFSQFVAEQLYQSNLSPMLLCFEISEAVVSRYPQQSWQLIERLRALGCQIALDDVSFKLPLQNLYEGLSIRFLKLSPKLVRYAAEQPDRFNKMQPLFQKAHDYDIEVVAKGVENSTLLSRLQQTSVDYVQGYELSKPAPV